MLASATQLVENICLAGTWDQEIVRELAATGKASTAASRGPVLTPLFGVEKSRRLGAWGVDQFPRRGDIPRSAQTGVLRRQCVGCLCLLGRTTSRCAQAISATQPRASPRSSSEPGKVSVLRGQAVVVTGSEQRPLFDIGILYEIEYADSVESTSSER